MDIVYNRLLEDIADTAPFKWNGTQPGPGNRMRPADGKVSSIASQSFTKTELADLVTLHQSRCRCDPIVTQAGRRTDRAQERGKDIFERTRPKTGAPIPMKRPMRDSATRAALHQPTQVDVGSGKTVGRSPRHRRAPIKERRHSPRPTCTTARRAPRKRSGLSSTPKTQHGVTNDLTKDELNDLIEYLKTL